MFDAAKELCDALIRHQVTEGSSGDFGGILCPHCEKAHARAGEAVFPLCYFYSETKDRKYLEAAVRLMGWLCRAQNEDGSWGKDSDGVSKADTVFLTTALCHTLQLVAGELDAEERGRLERMIGAGAESIYRNASPEWAETGEPGINCFAASCPALELAATITGEEKYRKRAKENAIAVTKRINEDGFLVGEGASPASGRPSVDVACDLEIGLGSLVVYSCLTGHEEVRDAALESLRVHLDFITPTGYIDGSWGTKVSEWMLLGNQWGSGCQTALLPLRCFDARFQRAAGQNLRFMLKNMVKDGLVTTGPHAKNNPDYVPCILPTVSRTKAACYGLIYSCGVPLCQSGKTLLPAEEKGWARFRRTVNVLQVRTSALLCTVAGYAGGGSKGVRRPIAPAGGTITHLWHARFGTVQAASCPTPNGAGTPKADRASGRGCVTPRIEAEIDGLVFSNIFEADAAISVEDHAMSDDQVEVRVTGHLKSPEGEDSGLDYAILYRFEGSTIRKEIEVRGRREATVRSVEPVVFGRSCDLLFGQNAVESRCPRGSSLVLTASAETTKVRKASRNDVIWNALPALYVLPIVVEPVQSTNPWRMTYQIDLRDWE